MIQSMTLDEIRDLEQFILGALSVSQDYKAIKKQVLKEFGNRCEDYFEQFYYLHTHPLTTRTFANILEGKNLAKVNSWRISRLANDNGFVIVHGYSDDIIVLSGAIIDEGGCFRGNSFHLHKEEDGNYKLAEGKTDSNYITAKWYSPDSLTENGDIICWSYDTDIPHEDFYMTYRGDPFCKGFVFRVSDLTDSN